MHHGGQYARAATPAGARLPPGQGRGGTLRPQADSPGQPQAPRRLPGHPAPSVRLRGVWGHSVCIDTTAMTLQQLCAARGLTLEQLAERAGVALATVVKIDDGSIRVQPAV